MVCINVKQNSLPSLVEEQTAGFSNKVKGRTDILQRKRIKILFLYIFVWRNLHGAKNAGAKNGKPYN
jgi:hypothetical protein